MNISIAIITIIICLILFEAFLTVTDSSAPMHDRFFTNDDLLGWSSKPNLDTVHAERGFNTHIYTNSEGIRVATPGSVNKYDKPNGTKRILVLGDSFAWGEGIEAEERFSNILEKKYLNNTQVINMGVDSYGTTQEYLQLKNRGLKYKPDIVILLVFFGNDIDDNLADRSNYYYRPVFTLDNNNLTLTNVPVPRNINDNSILALKKYLSKHSHVYNLGSKAIYKYLSNPEPLPYAYGLFSNKEYSPDLQKGWNLTLAIIKEMDTTAKENNATLLVVPVVSKESLYEEDYRTMMQNTYSLNYIDYNNYSKPDDLLIKFGDENNIEVLKLYPDFKKHYENGEQLFLEQDGHWNAKGNQLAAELINNKILNSTELHERII